MSARSEPFPVVTKRDVLTPKVDQASDALERQSDRYFAANLEAILARSQAWQNFKNSPDAESARLDWYCSAPEPSPLRKLALAVLVQAIHDAEGNRNHRSVSINRPIARVSATLR